ncbi:AAA-ATPase, partial [Actinidia chinensis var. chinensis]
MMTTMMGGGEKLTQLGSAVAAIMFIWAMFKQYFPPELQGHIEQYTHKLISYVYPFIQITFHEYPGDGFERSKAYAAIERYLSTNSTNRAKRLKADMVRDSKAIILSMDDYEEITDEYKGIKLWWASSKNIPKIQVFSFYGGGEEKRYYKLKFHRKHRETITKNYLNYVLEEGKAIEVRARQRKLYTNSRSEQWVGSRRTMWSHVVFEHPSTFDTLALEPNKKKEIINDLKTFSKAKDYYKKIGKAWKRGYLLYGPPGTGKSTMIAAMANLLEYDVYDLELTAVKDNTELRKLLIDTSSKSIIVIEDIDCSLDLTGQRKKKQEKDEKKDEEKDPVKKKMKDDHEESNSKVTLSGLLNFIDGLWSACG